MQVNLVILLYTAIQTYQRFVYLLSEDLYLHLGYIDHGLPKSGDL